MKTTFTAPDIECAGCANAIKNALSKVTGVASVVVDIEQKTVTVDHEAPTATVQTALDNAGFPAQMKA